MKLNKSVFRYIEHELYNYEATKKEIAEIREDVINGVPAVSELCTSIQSGRTSDTTGDKAEKLLTNSMLVRMCRTVDAIDRALRRLSENHRALFQLKYITAMPWESVCIEMPTSERSYFRTRKELVSMVALEMGLGYYE